MARRCNGNAHGEKISARANSIISQRVYASAPIQRGEQS